MLVFDEVMTGFRIARGCAQVNDGGNAVDCSFPQSLAVVVAAPVLWLWLGATTWRHFCLPLCSSPALSSAGVLWRDPRPDHHGQGEAEASVRLCCCYCHWCCCYCRC